MKRCLLGLSALNDEHPFALGQRITIELCDQTVAVSYDPPIYLKYYRDNPHTKSDNQLYPVQVDTKPLAP
jgi:hypothetical protein